MKSDPPRYEYFDPDRLMLIARREQFQNGPLRFGDIVRLNSGGPPSLIVDLPNDDHLTISWRDQESGAIGEATFPRECLHRVPYRAA
jgi:hypothetical protein